MTPVDNLVMAAVLAQLLAKGGRTLKDSSSIESLGGLAQRLLPLSLADQENVLGILNITGIEARTISLIIAAAMNAGLMVKPALAAAFDFGDFDKPSNQSGAHYIGKPHTVPSRPTTSASIRHQRISWPRIPCRSLRSSQRWWTSSGSTQTRWRMPSYEHAGRIFELSELHLPPGIVYEIKPWTSGHIAVAEAAMYCAGLQQAGIPAALGPVGFPGTFGALPAPNGYFIFEAPVPGVICYQYLMAPLVEIDARDRARGRQPRSWITAESLQQRFPIPGATLAFYVVAAGLLAALIEYGWTIILL